MNHYFNNFYRGCEFKKECDYKDASSYNKCASDDSDTVTKKMLGDEVKNTGWVKNKSAEKRVGDTVVFAGL